MINGFTRWLKPAKSTSPRVISPRPRHEPTTTLVECWRTCWCASWHVKGSEYGPPRLRERSVGVLLTHLRAACLSPCRVCWARSRSPAIDLPRPALLSRLAISLPLSYKISPFQHMILGFAALPLFPIYVTPVLRPPYSVYVAQGFFFQ